MRLRRGFTEYRVEISMQRRIPESKKNSMSEYRFVQVRHSVWLSSGGGEWDHNSQSEREPHPRPSVRLAPGGTWGTDYLEVSTYW